MTGTGKVQDVKAIRDLGLDLGILMVEERALGCSALFEVVLFVGMASCKDTVSGVPNTSGVPLP